MVGRTMIGTISKIESTTEKGKFEVYLRVRVNADTLVDLLKNKKIEVEIYD